MERPERPKRCVQCESVPEIENDGDFYYVECCGKSTNLQEDMNEALNEWNKINAIYHYIVGITYDYDEDNGPSRDLDFMIEYDNEIKKEIETAELFEKYKNTFGSVHENWNDAFARGYAKSSEVHLAMNFRGGQQHNLKRVCHFTSTFQISREEMKIMIKYMDKEKLKNATVRRFS